jgi:hypothetical protein
LCYLFGHHDKKIHLPQAEENNFGRSVFVANNIKPSTRAYSVLPEQMRRWRTMFGSLPVPRRDDSDEDNGNQPNHQLLQILNKKTAHQGGVGKSVGEFEMLRSTFDGLR